MSDQREKRSMPVRRLKSVSLLQIELCKTFNTCSAAGASFQFWVAQLPSSDFYYLFLNFTCTFRWLMWASRLNVTQSKCLFCKVYTNEIVLKQAVKQSWKRVYSKINLPAVDSLSENTEWIGSSDLTLSKIASKYVFYWMFFYYIKALWLEFISIVPQSIKCLCFISYILYSAQTPVNMCVGSEMGGGGCSFFLSQWEKCTLIGIPDAVTTETHSLSFPTHTHTRYSQSDRRGANEAES